MNDVEIAAGIVRAEVRTDDPERLAGAAMCYVQSRVRGWREDARTAAGGGFTSYAPAILALGAGYCGSNVIAWRAILRVLGIRTRQLQLTWTGAGHVLGEADWGDGWHCFDVQGGTVWVDGDVLDFDHVRQHPDERSIRVSNSAWLRYTHYEGAFVDPLAYLHVSDLHVRIVK